MEPFCTGNWSIRVGRTSVVADVLMTLTNEEGRCYKLVSADSYACCVLGGQGLCNAPLERDTLRGHCAACLQSVFVVAGGFRLV